MVKCCKLVVNCQWKKKLHDDLWSPWKVENCSNYKTISRYLVLLVTAIISAIWLRYHHFMSQIRLPLIRIITRSWSMDRLKFLVNSFAVLIFNLHESVFSRNSKNAQKYSAQIKTWNIFTKISKCTLKSNKFQNLILNFFFRCFNKFVWQFGCVLVAVNGNFQIS